MHRGLLALVIFINLVRFPVWAAEPQQCWVVFLLPRFNEQQLHIDADPGCWLSLTLVCVLQSARRRCNTQQHKSRSVRVISIPLPCLSRDWKDQGTQGRGTACSWWDSANALQLSTGKFCSSHFLTQLYLY